MRSDKTEKVQELFGDALELPPGERIAFVFSATMDNEVRGRVLRMLQQEQAIGDFMGTLAVFKQEEPGTQASERSFADGDLVADRYRVERLINCGGMGEVYEVYDQKLQQKSALKTILPEIASNPAIMERFRREITLARNVTHKNVCRVYDLGEHWSAGGKSVISFLTMEYVHGETLKDRLKRDGKMDPTQALQLIRQMAEALGAAHEVGVIHRDFKPANVLLVNTAEGKDRVVVSDFGLARTIENECSGKGLTVTGQILGTPEYMSPEQRTGRGIGPATDIYALGVVISDIMTGKRPTSPEQARDPAEERWQQVVDWCLSADPAARPQTVADVVRALEGTIQPSGRPSKITLPAKWIWVTAILLSMALALFVFRLLDRKENLVPAGRAQRIAVLPLRVDTQDVKMFADGLTDAITSRLAQYQGSGDAIFIVPASEVRREDVQAASVARTKFGVQYVVEASLHTQGDRVRLMLNVIDAVELRQKESAFVDGVRANALALQDAAVIQLVNMLNVEIQPKHARELNRLSPLDPGAYDFYLQAKGYLKRSDQLSNIEYAIVVLDKALRLDPDYAPAHTALGEAYWLTYERTSDSRWVSKALQECGRALELDTGLAEAHTIMGTVYSGTGRYPEAIQELKKALAIDSRRVDTHLGLGNVYVRAKEFANAEASFRKAIELQRQDWRGYKELGLLYYHQSDYRRAVEQFEKVVDLTPDNSSAYTNLGAFYGLLKNPQKSEEMLNKALKLEPRRIGALTNMAKLLFDQGRYAEAAARWEQAVAIDASSYRLWGNLGAVYMRLNRIAEARQSYNSALRLLDEAIAVNQKNGELYSYRAHFLSPLGRKKEALADLAKTDSMNGTEKEMLVRDADTFIELGDIVRARTLLKKAFDLGYPRDEAERNERLRPAL